MIQVTLSFPTDDDEFEGPLDAVDALPAEVVADPSLLAAELSLCGPGGALSLSDEALALIPALGAQALVDLLRDGTATAAMWSWRGRVNLDLEGDQVRLSGDGVPDMRVPLGALAEGVLSVSRRFAALLRRSALAPEIASRLELATEAAEPLLDAPRSPAGDLPPLSGQLGAPLTAVEGDQLVVTLEPVAACLRLRLSSPAGALELVEPLEPILDQVFLRGLRRLSAGRHVRYVLKSRYGYLRLFFEGGALRICGDSVPDISAPLGAGLRILYQAAEDLIRVWPGAPWQAPRVDALAATRTALALARHLDAPVPARVLAVLQRGAGGATARCELGGQEFTVQVEGEPHEGETCWAHLEIVPEGPVEAGPGGALQVTRAEDGRTSVSAVLNNRRSLRLLAAVPLYIGGGVAPEAITTGKGLRVTGVLRLVREEPDPLFIGREAEIFRLNVVDP